MQTSSKPVSEALRDTERALRQSIKDLEPLAGCAAMFPLAEALRDVESIERALFGPDAERRCA